MKKADAMSAFRMMTTYKSLFEESADVVNMKCTNVVQDVLQALVKNFEDFSKLLNEQGDSLTRRILSDMWDNYMVPEDIDAVKQKRVRVIVSQMIHYVRMMTGLPEVNILFAWIDLKHDGQLHNEHIVCLAAFKEYIFGTHQTFRLSFGIPGEIMIKYWISMVMSFDKEETKLQFIVQDLENDIGSYDMNSMKLLKETIGGAFVDKERYINCKVEEDTISKIALFINKVFGNGVFMTDVSINPKLTMDRRIDGHGHLERFDQLEFYEQHMDKVRAQTSKDIITSDFW